MFASYKNYLKLFTVTMPVYLFKNLIKYGTGLFLNRAVLISNYPHYTDCGMRLQSGRREEVVSEQASPEGATIITCHCISEGLKSTVLLNIRNIKCSTVLKWAFIYKYLSFFFYVEHILLLLFNKGKV